MMTSNKQSKQNSKKRSLVKKSKISIKNYKTWRILNSKP